MKSGKRNIILFFAIILFLVGLSKNVQASYDLNSVANNIEQTKTWVVKFNNGISKATVNSTSVTITDINGALVAIDVAVRSDNTSIAITPKFKLDYGKIYILNLKKSIQSNTGQELPKDRIFKFKIKEDSNPYVVCIDAGHGGSDAGNIASSGLKEKDVTLSTALKLGAILSERGVKVVYTRTTDKDIGYKERFDDANNAKANVFISLHCNNFSATSTGIETWYTDNDNIGVKFAQSVQDEFVVDGILGNRGVKIGQSTHTILRGTIAPAIMVQMGFLSNPNDVNIVGSTSFQDTTAKSIADGILKSLSLIDKNKEIGISSISDITKNIQEGEAFSLPLNIPAGMTDGTIKNVNVIWDNDKIEVTQSGTYTFKGTVAGYSSLVTFTLTINRKQDPGDGGIVIVIDPGHGVGRDAGAEGYSGVKERDITLPVALKVGQLLQSKGIMVVYTRTTDETSANLSETESLQRRCDTAINANAKYLISIHCNSFDQQSANGTEVLAQTGNKESEALATSIQKNLVNELGTYSRGVKDGNWLYLSNNSKSIVVLSELGFISNAKEEALLNSEDGQTKAANGIAKGILEYLQIK